jgi:quinol monooxygenase YgiN
MIIGTVRILPPPDRRDAVVEVLRSVQGPVRAQPGCAACDVFDERGPEAAVVLLERWETEEALEEHLRSEAYRRVIAAVELSGAQPEIRFEHVAAVEGLELVERLRNPGTARVGG